MLGVTLEWLAVTTGVSYHTVYAYRRGARKAPAKWLAKVDVLLDGRSALSVPADTLS